MRCGETGSIAKPGLTEESVPGGKIARQEPVPREAVRADGRKVCDLRVEPLGVSCRGHAQEDHDVLLARERVHYLRAHRSLRALAEPTEEPHEPLATVVDPVLGSVGGPIPDDVGGKVLEECRNVAPPDGFRSLAHPARVRVLGHGAHPAADQNALTSSCSSASAQYSVQRPSASKVSACASTASSLLPTRCPVMRLNTPAWRSLVMMSSGSPLSVPFVSSNAFVQYSSTALRPR